jgi:hypothetical protein
MASRNAKMSNRNVGKAGGGFVPSPMVRRIVPTGGGRFAYVAGADGRNPRMSVSDPALVPALVEIEAALPGRVTAEVAVLAESYGGRWAEVRDELAAALAAPVDGDAG